MPFQADFLGNGCNKKGLTSWHRSPDVVYYSWNCPFSRKLSPDGVHSLSEGIGGGFFMRRQAKLHGPSLRHDCRAVRNRLGH